MHRVEGCGVGENAGKAVIGRVVSVGWFGKILGAIPVLERSPAPWTSQKPQLQQQRQKKLQDHVVRNLAELVSDFHLDPIQKRHPKCFI